MGPGLSVFVDLFTFFLIQRDRCFSDTGTDSRCPPQAGTHVTVTAGWGGVGTWGGNLGFCPPAQQFLEQERPCVCPGEFLEGHHLEDTGGRLSTAPVSTDGWWWWGWGWWRAWVGFQRLKACVTSSALRPTSGCVVALRSRVTLFIQKKKKFLTIWEFSSTYCCCCCRYSQRRTLNRLFYFPSRACFSSFC